MAKDPAVLWYFDNWDGGTKLFTRHQKGCYMDLLSAQFHCGRLTIENIKTILGSDFSEWNKCLSEKFEADESGKFFNGRMEHEIFKRQNHKKGNSEGGKKAMQIRWGNKSLIKSLNKSPINLDNNSLKLKLNYETEDVLKGGVGEKDFSILQTHEIDLAFEFMSRIGKTEFSREDILNFWEAFVVHKPDYTNDSRGKQMQHFRDWLKFRKKEDAKSNGASTYQNKQSGLGKKSGGFGILSQALGKNGK